MQGRGKNPAKVRGTWHYSGDTPLTDLQVVIVIADILQVRVFLFITIEGP